MIVYKGESIMGTKSINLMYSLNQLHKVWNNSRPCFNTYYTIFRYLDTDTVKDNSDDKITHEDVIVDSEEENER